MLQKDSLSKEDRDAIKKAAQELLGKLTGGKLQIDRWREKAAAQAQVKAEIIKHLWGNLPLSVYDADEIDLKASAVFPTFTPPLSETNRGCITEFVCEVGLPRGSPRNL